MKYKTDEQKADLHRQLIKWLGICETSSAETTWNEEAEEDYKFYAGDQDTTEVKMALEAQKRPNTTYNEVKPKIDMLSGMGAQMEGSLTIMPRTLEDAALTELFTGTIDFFREKMRLNRRENSCFEHAVKSGLSWLHFYVEEDSVDNPIKCLRVPGRDMHCDPDSIEYNKSDARFLFRDKWFTAEDIEQAWPQFEFPKDSAGNIQTDNFTAVHATTYKPTFFNEANDKHRVVEGWWRCYEKKYVFLNPLTQKETELFKDEFNAFKKELKDGFELPNGERVQQDTLDFVPKTVKSIYYAIFNGMEILEVARSIYRHEMFPYVYFEAYHDEDQNVAMSAVSSMKDPQRGLNTTRRQLVHLLQIAPKGILIHEVGAVLDIEDYEENSAKAGFHLEVAKGALDKLKFTAQPQISPIYGQLDALFQQSMKDSSGIQDSLMGIQQGTREPGVTARQRLDTSIAVLHTLFDNYKESKYIATKMLISLIQQFVTDAQLIRIKGQKGYELMEINSQLNPQTDGWNDITSAQFDIIVDNDVVTKSTRLAVAQMLTDFSHNNPGSIPPDLMLEYSGIPFTAQTRVRQHSEQQQQMGMVESQLAHSEKQKELELDEREVIVKEGELDLKIWEAKQERETPKPESKPEDK